MLFFLSNLYTFYFILFFCLITLAGISSTMLNKSEFGHSDCFEDNANRIS